MAENRYTYKWKGDSFDECICETPTTKVTVHKGFPTDIFN